MNRSLNAVVICILFALLLGACSKGNDRAPNIDPRTGKHPAGWAAANSGGAHPAAFLSVPSSCYECHGKDLMGGISKVSCFTATRSGMTCHVNGPSGHPAGWSSPDAHGLAAKAPVGGIQGMAYCRVCHGADFAGGAVKRSCLNTAGCHGAGIYAAHSPKPWRDVAKVGARSHTNADPSNAAACAVCHSNGANSDRKPAPAAPAGTAPGCFNNTLCHGQEGHATGWASYSSHGRAAKAASGGIVIHGQLSPVSSFGACTNCHGTAYDGGSAQQSCLQTAGCHGANVASPHPARPWLSTTGGVTHTNTDTANADQCAVCHRGGANSTRVPRQGDAVGITRCFDNTLCHGVEGHPAGWSAPSQHGATAKRTPTATSGFSACQVCHGSTFNNGTPPACTNGLGCHGLFVSAPHPAKPWFSTTPGASTHTTTDPANAAVCAACHTAGANSGLVPSNPASGAAGCFNNTLCHFHQIPFAPPAVDPSVHGGQAKQDLRVCQNCHGVAGTTSFNGLTLPSGVTTTACSGCHTFAKAHPTDWQGSGTYSHRTAGNKAGACSLCHDVTQGRTAPLAAAPSCYRSTFSNSLGQSRTCHASGPGVAPHAVPYNNHNATARGNFNYCLGCHSVDVDVTTQSGKVIPRCLACHLASPVTTPTGCTSCHAAPPAGGAYPNFAGLHARHATLNSTNVCAECHNGLGLGTVDHLNRARARTVSVQANPVAFGPLASTGGLAPNYTAGTGVCAATYCHGNTLDKPATAVLSPSWSAPFLTGVAANDCAKCHGYPPATAIHTGKTPTQCIGCHPHVNASGTGFSDPSKHINGVIDANGSHSFPNPGSLHKGASGGTGCITTGCHAMGAAGSTYPVAVGTPPNCRACHLNANPTTDPRCSDCHGSSANDAAATRGRPTGASFPNRLGQHGRIEHANRVCTACHPFTTGDSRHGWSNRTRSTAAQVGGVGTSISSWNPTTKSCSPTCHGTETW